MRKCVIALCLAVTLALSLALGGCGDKARPVPPPTQPSSIEVRPREPESPAPEENPASVIDTMPQVSDEVKQNILLIYGAEESPDGPGSRLIPTGISLYYRTQSWEGSQGLTPGEYFGWFFSTTMKEDYEYKREAYKHPRGEEYGFFFPRDVYEERIQTYFEVSSEYLRSDETYYQEEYQGYCIGAGGGKGDTPVIRQTQWSQEGDILTAIVSLDSDIPGGDSRHTLTVRLEEGGGWKYLGDQVEIVEFVPEAG